MLFYVIDQLKITFTHAMRESVYLVLDPKRFQLCVGISDFRSSRKRHKIACFNRIITNYLHKIPFINVVMEFFGNLDSLNSGTIKLSI